MSKIFVQYGAGNIGRGFIGALFSQADYEVKFIDVVPEVIELLNRDHCYPIKIVDNEKSESILIQNVSAINGLEQAEVAEAIASADMMATSVGVNILPRIISNLLAGFRLRWSKGNMQPLNIIICENLLDADKFMHKLFFEQMNENEKVLFEKTIGLVEASIGRMVPVMTQEAKQENPLGVWVERYGQLPIDKAAFKGEAPTIANLVPFSPFEYYIRRKLFVHNMGHALSAYLGNIIEETTIWQAMSNPYVKIIVERAMLESAIALSKEFGVPLPIIRENITDLLLRFANFALGDTVARVGKDTTRKLSENDRFVGAMNLCLKQGVLPIYICIGIAAAFYFSDSKTEIADTLLREQSIIDVLHTHCKIEDSQIVDMIFIFYNDLQENDLAQVLESAEAFEKAELSKKIII